MTQMVRTIDEPLYEALRDEDVEAFNEAKANLDEIPSFAYCDFRGLDLRGLDADGLDLRHAYFRGADLRGIDFSNAQLEGASIALTKISGCYFPPALRADEITMSHQFGARMRYALGSLAPGEVKPRRKKVTKKQG
jgi:uncharacterized protein YjbI with pentapeptide repeats